jgi:anaphase-promoting complex subunit 1
MDMDNDETFASITLPAFDLRGELDLPSTSSVDYGAKLFSGNRLLLIAKHEVIIIKGTIITKKLTYEEEIITAMYTSFNNGKNLGGDGSHDPNTDALVVCVSKTGYIYYPDGRSYVVSFPFKIRNAHAFESGLVLERDQEAALTSIETYHPQQFNGAKFLTLVDPIGEFRIVATSSTSVISSNEKLVAFPLRGLNKLASLCATYNTQDGSIILYHIRSSLRNNKRLKPLGNMKKRKHSLLSTPNPSRILDDDLDFNQNIMSVNMEKKTNVNSTFRYILDCKNGSRFRLCRTIKDQIQYFVRISYPTKRYDFN